MRKYNVISALAEATAKEVTRNKDSWKRYLNMASRLYKYPFQEQLLIHAQRPDATACASIEIWNNNMHCWVNKGAKGIALLDEGSYTGLKYVFDISDVHKAIRIGRFPNLWELGEQHKESVIKQLEKTYGSTDTEQTFEARLIEIANRIAEDCYEELVSDMEYVAEGSSLEELDLQNMGIRIRETLASSIAYTLISRCGTDMELYQEDFNFDYIHDFNSVETLSVIGGAVTDLSKPVLMEIGNAVKAYDKALSETESDRIKNPEKELANATNVYYNALKRKSKEPQVTTNNEPEKKEDGNEPDIRKEWRLSDSAAYERQGIGGRDKKIWKDAGEVSEGKPERSVLRNAVAREVKESPITDPGSGRGADGAASQPDADSRWSDRGTQSSQSDALGAENEQHTTGSGGDRAGGTDLQLNTEIIEPGSDKLPGLSFDNLEGPMYRQMSLFPSMEEQFGNIAALEAGMKHVMPEAFTIQNEQIDDILRTGSGHANSRKRIYAKYQQGKTQTEMKEFLKQNYQTTGKGFIFNGEPVSTWFDEKGMRLGHGKSVHKNPLLFMDWEEIEKRVRSMVERGSYMSASEAYLIDESERSWIADHLYFFFRDGIGESPADLNIKNGNFPDSHAHLINMLADNNGIDTITRHMDNALEQIESGEKKLSLRSVVSIYELRGELDNLKADYRKFPQANTVEVLQEDFITQDEIDAKFRDGSNTQNGKFRIYEYFLENHSQKENIDFLKHEYGIGGSTNALIGSDSSYEDHDAKGIELKKGNIGNPYTKILLSWNVVEKRIRELVKNDCYLTGEGKEEYIEKYKVEQAEIAFRRAQKKLEQKKQENKKTDDSFSDIDTDKNRELQEKYGIVNKETAGKTDLENNLIQEKICDVVDTKLQSLPRIDKSGAVNYRILAEASPTSEVGKPFSPKEKFRQNVEAIHILEKIEGEHRIATPEEQKILAKYVGWGGLADAFDVNKANWHNEYQELKNLLSPDEYASARSSTLNAHYTSPVIIQSIYDAIGQMGFEKGNILEPAMGTGKFFGMLPEKMKDSRLYGVELDGITGRIAKQLYPHADIKITGFEQTEYPNDFFDVAVGNVPFGQYKVADRIYDKQNFLIHDYFFAKTLDKVRTGGIVAFVTSKGTMDKQSPTVRKYLAQRAELLGAVRLPNNAFKDNAGTEVTSDILFFKKRDRVIDLEPDWVYLAQNGDGIAMNDYFVEHPEMILGKMEMVSGPYGMEAACIPDLSIPLTEQLQKAVSRIEGRIEQVEFEELDDGLGEKSIPADPAVKNYSYTVVDDRVYYRENSMMKPVRLSDTMEQRVKELAGIRNCTQELIAFQLDEYPENMIQNKQTELNELYDAFSKKFGLINSRTNMRAFNEDSSYCLLCSLELLDDEGNFKGKADMFTKRTIKKQEVVTSVDTASEALVVSPSEKAKVDVPYMAELTGRSEEEVTKELAGIIFSNPVTDRWETADEYLSGNVREKLKIAKTFAENHLKYAANVDSLEMVQLKELDASEIEVRIGATWIHTKYIEDFMRDTFQTPKYLFERNIVGIHYSDVTGQWNVKGKNSDRGNSLVNMTYGTCRANAYRILEDSLNLRDTRIFDVVIEEGKEKRVLNKKETMLASQKQETIREAFKDWVFQEPERRKVLCKKYNEMFNSTRPREYDGSHLQFPGMTPDIILKPHQKNAVAHVLYGNNTLLAHCVGAGKTYEMTAAAMESKRLKLCQKSLFVVPNHITEQWASDFLRLYPGANILAATKKDFEPANRKKFCSRIATGEFDAVIIGHTQFEKIPLSSERQTAMIERQIEEIQMAIEVTKAEKGERYTIKQMEKTKKALCTKLSRLNDDIRKDNVVTFEQLGVDRLFVDESHNYKNLFLYTKMRNVAGIAQTEAQKSSDMFAKCQYLDEVTGGKGITFATGTPISNSMTELYTNMRYLQYNTLQRMGLGQFDSWAASFGETQTTIELAPEGTGYRAKTRFAKFFNLPELIALFKECADIQTPDMLKLPIPKAEYINEVLKPSDYQKDMVASLADRAEKVRNRLVQPNIDNMLKITNDGRKLALDQRLINDILPDEEKSKSAACVRNAYKIWEETKEQRSTQLIFCDLSTPKGKTKVEVDNKILDADIFENVYVDVRRKLIEKGVPVQEIAFIHDANTEIRKAELFAKVRSGQVRFLLGSTQKMGAGTNVQDKLIALHHLDVPWRPSDIEQQEGRILRQGNTNPKVKIFRYVTEGTFDSYSWQLIENKQKFIGQIMTSKSPVRSCEDIDEAALTYAEVKALATGNPYIKEKMDLDIQVSKLKLLKANHISQIYSLEDNIIKHYPQEIAAMKERIAAYQEDVKIYQQNKPLDTDTFSMKIGNRCYTDKKEAGSAMISMCQEMKTAGIAVTIGEYQGFKMSVIFDTIFNRFTVKLKGQLTHETEIGTDALGNIQRVNNTLEAMCSRQFDIEQKLSNVERQLSNAKLEVKKPFAQEDILKEKMARLCKLNALMDMDKKDTSLCDSQLDENEENIIIKIAKKPGLKL